MSIGASIDDLFADIKKSWKQHRCKHPTIWNTWRDTPGMTSYDHVLGCIRVPLLVAECPECGTQRYSFDLRAETRP